MREDKKIKVIYILGLGRSGSTLLERIIGGADNVWPLGEIRSLKEYIERDRIEESGEKMSDSKFWSPVVKNIKSLDLEIFDKHKSFNLKRLVKTLRKKENLKDEEKILQLILNRAKELESEEVDYLLDASKLISRFLLLRNQKNIDLHVVHLVRDGRGVINSFEKIGVNWFRILGRWLKNNLFISIFMKRMIDKRKFVHLSYDLFTKDPEKYLNIVNKKLGTNIDLNNYLKKSEKKQTYSISGNSMRSKPLAEIKNDQQWKKMMPAWKKTLLTVITYPFNKVWVYYEE